MYETPKADIPMLLHRVSETRAEQLAPTPTDDISPLCWRDIATAPTDGTPLLGWGLPPGNNVNMSPDVRSIRAWKIGRAIGWSSRNDFGAWTIGFRPTHWLPLPTLPISAESHS